MMPRSRTRCMLLHCLDPDDGREQGALSVLLATIYRLRLRPLCREVRRLRNPFQHEFPPAMHSIFCLRRLCCYREEVGNHIVPRL